MPLRMRRSRYASWHGERLRTGDGMRAWRAPMDQDRRNTRRSNPGAAAGAGRGIMSITLKRAQRCTKHTICDCNAYRIERMEMALRVIQTWASVPGALDPRLVRDLAERAMRGRDDG